MTTNTVRMDPWSFATVSWMTKIVILSVKKDLAGSDLPTLKSQDLAATTPNWVEVFLQQHRIYEETKKGKKPTLFSALIKHVLALWSISGFLYLLSIAALCGIPLVLQQVIDLSAFKSAVDAAAPGHWDDVPLEQFADKFSGFPLVTKSALILGFTLLGLKISSTVFGRLHDMITKRAAFNIRTVLINAIVKKSLTISSSQANQFSKGYILNLVNVDSESVSLATELIHQLWGLPAQIIVAISLLAYLLGSAIGAGVGAMFAAFALLGVTVPLLIISSLPKMIVAGDTRVKLIREALDGIKLIKIRSLDEAFKTKINIVRLEQLYWLKRFLYGVVSFVVIGQLANALPQVATFTLYAVRLNQITAGLIFPAAALFGMVVNPLIQLPQTLNSVISATVSWNRIYNFLIAPDREEVPQEESGSLAVSIEKGTFNWPAAVVADEKNDAKKKKPKKRGRKTAQDSEEGAIELKVLDEKKAVVEAAPPRNILVDIDLKIEKGTFVVVIGQVGSGKSSLLSAILGDLQMSSGKISANGSIAYCTQQPWIRTGTVEDNITFGEPLDEEKLQRAVTCASLQSDL
ncbi:UNVERIFIED_CONTAM: ATP-binding cassette sub- C member 8, partial [Siphonaria sp. JEL0065]